MKYVLTVLFSLFLMNNALASSNSLADQVRCDEGDLFVIDASKHPHYFVSTSDGEAYLFMEYEWGKVRQIIGNGSTLLSFQREGRVVTFTSNTVTRFEHRTEGCFRRWR